jgi:hypothetical protein
MIVAREKVPVSVHCNLQRRVAREGLRGLGGKRGFNPIGNREVSQTVPIEALDLGD